MPTAIIMANVEHRWIRSRSRLRSLHMYMYVQLILSARARISLFFISISYIDVAPSCIFATCSSTGYSDKMNA